MNLDYFLSFQNRENSKKKDKKSDDDLENLDDKVSVLNHRSWRGNGRALLTGGVSGVIGRYSGVNKYDSEIEEGKDEPSAKRKAVNRSAAVGAIAGGGLGLLVGHPISGAAYGAVGGALGIDKHVRSRHQKAREEKADLASTRFIEEHQKEYSKKEEKYLKQLRYENPDKYLEEVRKYRDEKRAGGLVGSLAHPFVARGIGNIAGAAVGAAEEGLAGAAIGTVSGGLAGLGAGVLTGGAQAIHAGIKYSKKKTIQDSQEIIKEKELKRSNPEKYERMKEEQKDTVAYMNNMISKSDFKKKWGHKPNTKI